MKKIKINSTIKNILQAILIIAVLIFVYMKLKSELKNIDFSQVGQLLYNIGIFKAFIIFCAGFAGVSILSIYDFVIVRALKLQEKIGNMRTYKISFMTNSLNMVLGFGGFIGGALRFYLYKPYYNNSKKLTSSIGMLLVSMLTGISCLAFLVVLGIIDASAIIHSRPWLYYALIIISLFFPIYLFSTYRKPTIPEDRHLAVKLAIISILDWLAAGTLIIYILHILNVDVSYSKVLGVFIVAAIAGLISMVPGGFGTFDLLILLGFSQLGISNNVTATILMLYRLSYYLIPFITGLFLILQEFWLTRVQKRYQDFLKPALDTSTVIFSLQKGWINKLPFLILGCLNFISAIILLLYAFNFKYTVTNEILSYSLIIIHIAASILLINSSLSLIQETIVAHLQGSLALTLLIFTNLFAEKGYFIIFWLMILLLLTILGINSTTSIRKPLMIFRSPLHTVIVSVITLLIYYLYSLSLKIFITDIIYNRIIALIIFISAIVIYALFNLITNIYVLAQYDLTIAHKLSIVERQRILKLYGGNYLAHLSFAGDKLFYTNAMKDAYLQFVQIKQTIIVLGNPIGNSSAFQKLLQSFYRRANYIGVDVIFYQTSSEYMALYHNFGNSFFKLGEEAIIDLYRFKLSGRKMRGLRSNINKFTKNGYYFEMIDMPLDYDVFEEIKQISDKWLNGKKELGFSFGQCTYPYLKKAPIAVIKNNEDKICAFATMMPTYKKDTITIDIVRFENHTEPSLVDFLYTHIILWAQSQSYHYFSLGTAPLSDLGAMSNRYLRERIAVTLFDNIHAIYGTQGLRRYKQKFKPIWRPRFLVYPKYSNILIYLYFINKAINTTKRISRRNN